MSPSLAALALIYSLQVTTALTWFVRQATDTEAQMTVVERLSYYTSEKIPNEPPAQINLEKKLKRLEILEKNEQNQNEKRQFPLFRNHVPPPEFSGGKPSSYNEILKKNWPKNGEIEFVDYTFRYRKDLPPVLDKISLKINPGEKIGVVGRTGSGKSTFVFTFFFLK